jgi:hypothetical protein
MFKQSSEYLTICFILITSLICNNAISQKNSQTKQGYSQLQISNTLKEFYTAYFHLQSDPYPLEKQTHIADSLLDRYCTKEFINFYRNIQGPEELDWDPFFDANYIEGDILKTIKISKDKVKNDLYYVSYLKKYSNEVTTIELSIIKEKEVYKINSLPQLTRHIDFVRSHK